MKMFEEDENIVFSYRYERVVYNDHTIKFLINLILFAKTIHHYI